MGRPVRPIDGHTKHEFIIGEIHSVDGLNEVRVCQGWYAVFVDAAPDNLLHADFVADIWIDETDEIRIDVCKERSQEAVVAFEGLVLWVSFLPENPVVPPIARLFACQCFEGFNDEVSFIWRKSEPANKGGMAGSPPTSLNHSMDTRRITGD